MSDSKEGKSQLNGKLGPALNPKQWKEAERLAEAANVEDFKMQLATIINALNMLMIRGNNYGVKVEMALSGGILRTRVNGEEL